MTKAVFTELAIRVRKLQEALGSSAGIDPLQDRFNVGAIQAYIDLLNIDFGEVGEQ